MINETLSRKLSTHNDRSASSLHVSLEKVFASHDCAILDNELLDISLLPMNAETLSQRNQLEREATDKISILFGSFSAKSSSFSIKA